MSHASDLQKQVVDNSKRIEACSRHLFDIHTDVGQAFKCKLCGGSLSTAEVRTYAAGFKAAGGDVNILFTNANEPRRRFMGDHRKD